MPTDLPLACSLTAAEMPVRLAEMSAIGKAALVSVEIAEGRATLRFTAGADTRGRLEAIVAAEAECCAFLTLIVRDQPGFVVLVIDAPPDAEPVLGTFIEAFGREAQPA